ncbi:hypothetical protein TWF696_008568 [Orbilia brochopaga]|uniref:Response regulatory domain-containing protein n=1 Tax=Orbilia brochopaga TaxID=3140254 RepID=A0AAV9UHF9_9PEZI
MQPAIAAAVAPGEPLSLQDFIDRLEAPTLVLDFRLNIKIEDARVADTKLAHNAVCERDAFKAAFDGFLAQPLETLVGRGDKVGVPISIGENLEGAGKKDVAGSSWLCCKLGKCSIWSMRTEETDGDAQTTRNLAGSISDAEVASVDGEVVPPSREEQLYRRLDDLQAPLNSFYKLSEQALKDAETARKLESSTDLNLTESLSHRLAQIELNLRTLTSGLSLLKDLSSISDIQPPPSTSPSHPKRTSPLSDKLLLHSIRNRAHTSIYDPPISPCSSWRDYVPSGQLEPYIPTLRVLIVEDNRINQRLQSKFTQKIGVLEDYITIAKDGVEGLEILEGMAKFGQFPDIMIVDNAMPRLDGYGFLEEFRNRWPAARTRIVGATAHKVFPGIEVSGPVGTLLNVHMCTACMHECAQTCRIPVGRGSKSWARIQ